MRVRRFSSDAIIIGLLIALWLLFFWRLWTPIMIDRTMIVEGDFSGQFVAFGAYQYERLTDGEIPLWNPYNNGGLPFIGDTQAAALYPPRLLTVGLSRILGGWDYQSLQLEMTLHILVYTLLMYAFVRRLTLGQGGSVTGGFVAAIAAGYGGFITSYPPLQLALLEAAIWLPLALLGILEATRRQHIDRYWFLLTGLALGLTWMAGHPQTALYATYFSVAYLAYRTYTQRYGWLSLVLNTFLIGVIAFGLVAVQFIPGIEYTLHSMRGELTFGEKGNGFPFQDVAQFVFPRVVSIWSPLFIGVTGLVFAVLAAATRARDGVFWIGAVIVALVLSFGANSAVYHLAYTVLPGMQFFRGQERAAYLVAINLSILAGLGVVALHMLDRQENRDFVRYVFIGLAILLGVSGIITLCIFVLWFGQQEFYFYVIGPVFFSTLIAAGLLFVMFRLVYGDNRQLWFYVLAVLLVFELFSVNIDNDNYEPYRADVLDAQAYIESIQADDSREPFRIDANLYALDGNMATLHRVMDIRGISPLFVDGPHAIIQRELPSEIAWELFAVKYVLTGAPEIPVDAELLSTDQFEGETVHLFRIIEPRPYALLQYQYEVLDSDAFARALLADPNFDERTSVILAEAPVISMPEAPPDSGQAVVTTYAPERITVEIETSENAIVSLAHVDYPGWRAKLNDERVDTIRAYGALIAVPVPAGTHTLTLVFDPLSYQVGAIISAITWVGLIVVLGLWSIIKMRLRGGDAGQSDSESPVSDVA